MHRRLINSARLELRIEPYGPILIKSGIETPDPTRAGLEFVRTRHSRLGETVYLPGTSLKGAFRSHAERALRGLGVDICDPLSGKSTCRSIRVEDDTPTPAVFAAQCPACRTFGSLKVAGRLNFSDAMPWSRGADPEQQQAGFENVNRTEPRFQVGISRDTGGVHGGALYDLELVVAGEFFSELHLRNFELWQLALVFAMASDLNDGVFAIGFGKSRGLGRVRASLVAIDFEATGTGNPELLGSAAHSQPGDYGFYAAAAEDRIDLPAPLRPYFHPSWRGSRLSLDTGDKDGHAGIEQLAGLLQPRLESFIARAQERAARHAGQ